MNRKSRLATGWARMGPRIDAVVESMMGGMERGALRGFSRTLACWCVRLSHSKIANENRATLLAWLEAELAPNYRELARIAFSLWKCEGSFDEPLTEIAELARTRVMVAGEPAPTALDIVNRVHEFLLWLETPLERRTRGAYYTPQCVARTVMELAQERAISMTPDGLGIWSSSVKVVDFAAGTGAFFAAGLELKPIASRAMSDWTGIEIDAETHAIGQFCLACQRIELGLPLDAAETPHLIGADSLDWVRRASFELPSIGTDSLLDRHTAGLASSGTPVLPVIVGNPPYSAFGGRDAVWVDELLRGKDPYEDIARVSYHRDGKQSAKHRKHSLADDYVRFLRVAHWLVERAERGVIALILNHNILENRSFADLRRALTDYFDETLLLDLHGNAKRRELTPEGSRDESVFNIEQGTMIAILAKWPQQTQKQSRVGHVYGLRDEKIAKIVSRQWESELADAAPVAPQFYFHCERRAQSRLEQAYAEAPSLADIFSVHSTAIVTARDAFVVDDDLQRLETRIGEFADLRSADDAIRAKYFSGRGDTRSWKLDRARRALSEEGIERVEFAGFWYRPWDYRWLAYSKHLIDWRRESFSPLLLGGKNLALIARRQSPPGGPCNYFWTTNSVVVDGILRSDNRGTESVFPLYSSLSGEKGMFNIATAFLNAVKEQLALNELDLFYVLVAILHSGAYQHAFREMLWRDFPRVPLPRDGKVAAKLAGLGREIADAEMMHCSDAGGSHGQSIVGDDFRIAPGFPKFRGEGIWLNSSTRWEGVAPAWWELKAGAHQPILRWLKQRRSKELSASDLEHFERMLEFSRRRHEATRQLHELLRETNGLEGLFFGKA